MAAPSQGIVVLCPLEIEAKAVTRAVKRAGVTGVRVVRTGPGPAAVRRAVGVLCAEGVTRPRLAILAGLAGGLSKVPDLPTIVLVVNLAGRKWTPTGAPPVDRGAPAFLLLGADEPAVSVAQKRQLHDRTAAALIDTESHAFAEACDAAGILWTVVREVSDRYDEALPAEAAGWVGADGVTLVKRVLGDVVRRPRLLGEVMRLARRARRGLPRVGKRVVELVLDAHERAAAARGSGKGRRGE